jgi:hypothetical protein
VRVSHVRFSVSERLSAVTTPPRVARVEVDAALNRIAARRRQIDDERFGQVDADDPAAVLDYLRTHGGRLPRDLEDMARKDVDDGLVLVVWLWWEDRRREYELLLAGVRLGMPLSQLGAPLGLGSRVQSPDGNRRRGVQDRIDRLAALLKYDRPDARITREARRVDQERTAPGDPQAVWLRKHGEWVSAVAARLLAYYDLADEEAAEYLVEVRHDWREESWTPGSLVWMGLAAAALRVSPGVVGLGDRHGVQRALKDVEDLRTAFAELSDAG